MISHLHGRLARKNEATSSIEIDAGGVWYEVELPALKRAMAVAAECIGHPVPCIMGGNTFGRYCDEARTAAVIHRALDLGINHFDTAELYQRGVSEQLMGGAVRAPGRGGDRL